MKSIVAKFGGSNLKTPNDIGKIVETVKKYNRPLVTVVSAFYGITDTLTKAMYECTTDESKIQALEIFLRNLKEDLIQKTIPDPEQQGLIKKELTIRLEELKRFFLGIHYLGEVPELTYDKILSYGERLSSFLLTAIFRSSGIDAVEMLPEDIGLYTNGEYRNATIDFAKSTDPVSRALKNPMVYVIPGFYGISPEGKITLLGRGGSDYSAAAIARCIGAESLDIWKDVDGFMSADPGIVDHPQALGVLSYREAAELSYFGARILHPRTVEPLRDGEIPIRLFNIHRFQQGIVPLSIISGGHEPLKNSQGELLTHKVKSVTYSHDFAILRLSGSGVGQAPGVLSKATSVIASRGLNIKSVVTTQTAINIFLSESDVQVALNLVRTLGLGPVSRLEALEDLSIIALVGEGLSECEEIAQKLVTALSGEGVHMKLLSLGASESATYCVVQRNKVVQGIRAIHRVFFEESQVDSNVPNN